MLRRTTGGWQNLVKKLPGGVARKAMRLIRSGRCNYGVSCSRICSAGNHVSCDIKISLVMTQYDEIQPILLFRQFPEREDFEFGAAVGILAIQLYYNLSYTKIILGGEVLHQ